MSDTLVMVGFSLPVVVPLVLTALVVRKLVKMKREADAVDFRPGPSVMIWIISILGALGIGVILGFAACVGCYSTFG